MRYSKKKVNRDQQMTSFSKGFSTIILFLVALSISVFPQSWTSISSLNTARYGATAVTANSLIYVIGGFAADGSPLESVEIYNPDTGIWVEDQALELDDGYAYSQSIYYNSQIFLSGGFNEDFEVTDDIIALNFLSGLWADDEEMRRPRRNHVFVTLSGRLCAMGGIKDQNGNYELEVEYQDIGGDWVASPTELPQAVASPFYGVRDNYIYLLGGIFNTPVKEVYRGELLGIAWNFDWQMLPDLSEERGLGTSTTNGDSIYMFGGLDKFNNPLDIVEIFDMSTETIDSGPNMMTPRIAATSTLLNDRIYVIGGYNASPSQPLASVEALDCVVSISDPVDTSPESFTLFQSYPNPFNGNTTLKLSIKHSGSYKITIYDLQGRLIRNLAEEFLLPGTSEISWDAKDNRGEQISSGVYFAILEGNALRTITKLVYSR